LLGLHSLTVLEDETIDLLLNTCPEIRCGLAVPEKTGSNDESASASLFLHTASLCTFYVLNKLIKKFKVFHPHLFLPNSSLEQIFSQGLKIPPLGSQVDPV